jgi:UDP-GlcNAc:undecaprenyl-phosphate GlcNAc-1-phosphate transferase
MGPTIHFGILSIPITVIWIVAITNAINLIDGLDITVIGILKIPKCIVGPIGNEIKSIVMP